MKYENYPLDLKIKLTEKRIVEWFQHWGGDVYVSFSGGKDSTVLLDIARGLYPDMPAAFVDTGLEFPEIRDFVKTVDNVIWLKPKLGFRAVLDNYGYPIVSKEQACYIDQYRNTKSEKLRNVRWNGKPFDKYNGVYGKISEKWKYLVDAPFKISDRCCYVMKKAPLKSFERKHKLKPIIGTMATESSIRKINDARYGCNAFDIKRPISSPLSFWKECDIWEYIKTKNIKYSKIYDMGYDRTGCMFCMFGLHMEKHPNRLEKMKATHPKQYDYCMKKLGIEDVLKYYPSRQLDLF